MHFRACLSSCRQHGRECRFDLLASSLAHESRHQHERPLSITHDCHLKSPKRPDGPWSRSASTAIMCSTHVSFVFESFSRRTLAQLRRRTRLREARAAASDKHLYCGITTSRKALTSSASSLNSACAIGSTSRALSSSARPSGRARSRARARLRSRRSKEDAARYSPSVRCVNRSHSSPVNRPEASSAPRSHPAGPPPSVTVASPVRGADRPPSKRADWPQRRR